MDFRHPIVTCLFSMLRLSFETQKVKENYAIFLCKALFFLKKIRFFSENELMFFQPYTTINYPPL